MALTYAGRAIRPLTADDVMAMARHGILDEDERVELLHGVLTKVMAQHPPHAVVTRRLNTWLAPLLVAGAHEVSVQLPFVVPDRTSLPEPDIAVIERDDEVAHPATALLVIEVAASSLARDTEVKAPLYAEAGVPEYWVVDLTAWNARIYRDPKASGYASEQIVETDGMLAPVHLDIAPLSLRELLAGI